MRAGTVSSIISLSGCEQIAVLIAPGQYIIIFMASFKITGGKSLKGGIHPQGAKNEALQILCAVLFTAEPVTLHNIPAIRDVNQLINLLEDLGVSVERLGGSSVRFQADDVNLGYLESDLYKQKAT